MKKYFIVFFAMTSMFLYWSCRDQDNSVIEMVTAEEMSDLLDQNNFKLLDVRTPAEFQTGAIENAVNMDYLSDAFNIQIKTLDPSEPIIVYCKSGGRSSACAEFLEKNGFVKVYNLEGGISQWTNLGLPVVSPD